MRLLLRPTMALAAALLAGAVSVPARADDTAPGPCGQVVLIGTVTKSAYLGPINEWNGEWRLDIEVRRVLRGTERRRQVVATAAAEASIRTGMPFVFFLNPGPNGDYGVDSADPDIARGKGALAACRGESARGGPKH